MTTRNKRVLVYEETDSNPRGHQWTTRYFLLKLTDGSIRLSKSKTDWGERIIGYYHNGDQLFEALRHALDDEGIPIFWLDRTEIACLVQRMDPVIAQALNESWQHCDDQAEALLQREDQRIALAIRSGRAGTTDVQQLIDTFLERFSDEPRVEAGVLMPSDRQLVRSKLKEVMTELGTLPRNDSGILAHRYVDIPWLRERILWCDGVLR
jgi:hypothetical protein